MIGRPWNPTTTVTLGSNASSLLRFASRHKTPRRTLIHQFRVPSVPQAASTNNANEDKCTSARVYGVSTYYYRDCLAGVVLVWGRMNDDLSHGAPSQKSDKESPWVLEIYPWVPEPDPVNLSLEDYCCDSKSVRKLITWCRGLVNKTETSDFSSPKPDV